MIFFVVLSLQQQFQSTDVQVLTDSFLNIHAFTDIFSSTYDYTFTNIQSLLKVTY